MEGEYENTVPLDDTIALGSPEAEAHLRTLDINTEVLSTPDSIDCGIAQSLDDIVDDSMDAIPLDIDKDGSEVVGKIFPLKENKTSVRGHGSCMEKRKMNALGRTVMLDKDVTGHSIQQLASTRRTDERGDTQKHELASSHADTSNHKQQFIQDSGTSEYEEALPDHSYNIVQKDYKSLESIGLSVVNALDFVDHFLAVNNQYLCGKFENARADGTNSPPPFTTKGAQTLASRTNLATRARELGMFDWEEKQATERNSDKKQDEKFAMGSPGKPSEQDQSATNGQDIFEFGFDTQMAAEAMEALICAPPPNSREQCTYQVPKNEIHNSSVNASKDEGLKHSANKKVADSGPQINRKRTVKLRSPTSRLNGNKPLQFKKHSENLTGYNSPSSINKNLIYREPLSAKSSNCGHALTMKKSICGRSSRVISQQKNGAPCESENSKGAGNDLVSLNFIGLNQHGEEMLFKKFRRSSQKTKRTEFQPSMAPVSSFKRRISANLEFDVPKKRRKKRLGIGVCKTIESKSLMSASDGLAEVTRTKGPQQPRSTSGSFGTIDLLKLDPWCYPKQKRTHKGVRHQSNGFSNSSTLLTLADDENKNKYPTENRLSSWRNCGPLLHSQTEFGSSPEKNLPGVCESAITSEEMIIMDLDRVKSSELYGKSDMMGTIWSVDCSENIRLGAVSADIRASQTTKTDVRIPGKKLISRPSLMKELTRLGYNKSLPNFMPRELRRRRRNVCVLFSQHLKSNVLNQQKKILARLGFSIASCCSDATHFVIDGFVRTRNMLEAIAFGKPVVTHLWLESCGQANSFIDEKSYILRDTKKENEIGFSMPASLACARENPLLQGRRVFITPNVKPSIELIQSLVKAVHGKVIKGIGRAAQGENFISKELLVLTSEEDYVSCLPILEKGAAVYDSELLLNGIVIQKLEFERHQLFTNCVEDNCSKKCPEKN
ncbi:uncharacterized protein [Coffea arabica]|uniref:BRCT domain-containing protein n=1 Tax=Coffea arabica TaxID=13443 RepID=A0A6P6WN44_COFAR